MLHRMRWIVVTVCAVAHLGLARAMPAQVSGPPLAAADSARTLVERFRMASEIPGLSVAVGVDSAVVWAEGFGMADEATGRPVTTETRFRIGSISMPLTAAAIGLLWEQGTLNLGADIRAYVPSFPEKDYPITVGQLAGHLAGIRHYRDREYWSNIAYATVAEGLEIFEHDSLIFEPGTRYSFSTYGWSLLSAAIEHVTGQPFLVYMQEHVLDPLALLNTVPDRAGEADPQRSVFYERVDGRLEVAPPVDNSYKWAGGGFLSTPTDLVRFGLAHLRPGFLAERTIRRFWTGQHTRDGAETGYGIGWTVGTDADEHAVVSHTGSSVGGRAILLVYPESRVVVALTANVSGVRYGSLPQDVAHLFGAR
ncbi:MAG: beta-lactamase family protein [Gemmatimonadales bacterium]|nr:beta-lactamase family protein [Gemmatimonadales bacterium]